MVSSMIPEAINVSDAITQIKTYLLDLQNRVCQFLEAEDGTATFSIDQWNHEEGGGGISRSLVDGHHLEKAGVNFSHVHGKSLPHAATVKRPDLADCPFQ